MKVNALYHQDDPNEDGRIVHVVDYDGGAFVVSSQEVGIAAQNFLNAATTMDIRMLHGHLLDAFRQAWEREVAEQLNDEEQVSGR